LAMGLVLAAANAPMIGGLASFVALLTGIGAIVLQMRRGNSAARYAT